MSDLNLLLRLMNQQTSAQEGHMEDAATVLLLGMLTVIGMALLL